MPFNTESSKMLFLCCTYVILVTVIDPTMARRFFSQAMSHKEHLSQASRFVKTVVPYQASATTFFAGAPQFGAAGATQPQPYSFAFQSNDNKGSSLAHQEKGDGSGAVSGSYGYVDPNGVYRKVDYIADVNGYRAVIRTNEPGTGGASPANVQVVAEQGAGGAGAPAGSPQSSAGFLGSQPQQPAAPFQQFATPAQQFGSPVQQQFGNSAQQFGSPAGAQFSGAVNGGSIPAASGSQGFFRMQAVVPGGVSYSF